MPHLVLSRLGHRPVRRRRGARRGARRGRKRRGAAAVSKLVAAAALSSVPSLLHLQRAVLPRPRIISAPGRGGGRRTRVELQLSGRACAAAKAQRVPSETVHGIVAGTRVPLEGDRPGAAGAPGVPATELMLEEVPASMSPAGLLLIRRGPRDPGVSRAELIALSFASIAGRGSPSDTVGICI